MKRVIVWPGTERPKPKRRITMDDYITSSGRLIITGEVDSDDDVSITLGSERTFIGKEEAAEIVKHLEKVYATLHNGEFDRG